MGFAAIKRFAIGNAPAPAQMNSAVPHAGCGARTGSREQRPENHPRPSTIVTTSGAGGARSTAKDHRLCSQERPAVRAKASTRAPKQDAMRQQIDARPAIRLPPKLLYVIGGRSTRHPMTAHANITTKSAAERLCGSVAHKTTASVNCPISCCAKISDVIRYPDMTQRRQLRHSLPRRHGTPAWKSTTATTAIARRPSMSGLYFNANAF